MISDNKSLMEVLQILDDELSNISQKIVANITESYIFKDDIFEESCIIDDIDNRPLKLRGKKGIYVFQVIKDVDLTREQVRGWNDKCCGASFNDWYQGDLKEGDILYVGSCISKSLFVRVREHFLDKTTVTSLRLGSPSRKMVYDKVRVYTYPIKKGYEDYYRFIIPLIEKKLHNLLKPLAGSSRV